MTGISTYLSIITNVNGLNSLIKMHRLVDWTKKEVKTNYCLPETHLTDKDKIRLKVKDRKVFHANGAQKQAGVVILLMSDKSDFKSKLVKEHHFILTKVTTYQKE
jgi:hypothetical protein